MVAIAPIEDPAVKQNDWLKKPVLPDVCHQFIECSPSSKGAMLESS